MAMNPGSHFVLSFGNSVDLPLNGNVSKVLLELQQILNLLYSIDVTPSTTA